LQVTDGACGPTLFPRCRALVLGQGIDVGFVRRHVNRRTFPALAHLGISEVSRDRSDARWDEWLPWIEIGCPACCSRPQSMLEGGGSHLDSRWPGILRALDPARAPRKVPERHWGPGPGKDPRCFAASGPGPAPNFGRELRLHGHSFDDPDRASLSPAFTGGQRGAFLLGFS